MMKTILDSKIGAPAIFLTAVIVYMGCRRPAPKTAHPPAKNPRAGRAPHAHPAKTRCLPAKLETWSEKQMAVANDRKADRQTRCRAIFALFANRVRNGMTAAQIHTALMDPNWLGDINLYGVYALGGMVPVNISAPQSTVFCLHLFPDKKGWSEWVIYFRLHGKSGLTRRQGLSFLQSTLKDKNIRLAEYALCFPGGKKILRFAQALPK
jgi:hypothetical protein